MLAEDRHKSSHPATLCSPSDWEGCCDRWWRESPACSRSAFAAGRLRVHRGGALWATDARPEAAEPCTSGALPPRRPMAASVVSPGRAGHRREARSGAGGARGSRLGWCCV